MRVPGAQASRLHQRRTAGPILAVACGGQITVILDGDGSGKH